MRIPPAIDARDRAWSERYAALSPARRRVWWLITLGGYAELWWPIFIGLMVYGRVSDDAGAAGLWRLGLRLAAAEWIALAVLIPARYLWRRERPVPKKPTLPIVPWERYSFPSSHATRGLAMAVVLTAWRPVVGWAALPAALLIAWSRLPLRKHYPSDVLVGAVLGAVCGAAAVTLVAAG